MIWHIFMKDWRVLSRSIYAVALVNAISTAAWITLGPVASGAASRNANFISFGAMACMLMLIAAAVQQDTPAASEQDWRVRPIQRRDLLLAKFLFAIVAVHGPLLVLDAIGGVAQGFALLPSFGAALARGSAIFVSLTLPAMILATLTRDLTGWNVAALGLSFLMILSAVALGSVVLSQPNYGGTGFSWIPTFVNFVLTAIAAAIILPLRYFAGRKATALAVLAGAFVLSVLATLLPWNVYFAIQRAFASQAVPDDVATVSFSPIAGVATQPAGVATQLAGVDSIRHMAIPVRISRIPPQTVVMFDGATARLLDSRGSVVYARDPGCVRGAPERGLDCTVWHIRVHKEGDTGEATLNYPFGLPERLYSSIRNERLRVEIDYYISLLERDSTWVMDTLHQRTGHCVTYSRYYGVEFRCLNTVAPPACVRVLGEPRATGPIAQVERCRPDYAPLHFARFPDVVRRSDSAAWFPPSGWGFSEAYGFQSFRDDERRTVERYRARSHIKRTVAIDNVRLADWGG
jgi:hypothetical protein